MLPLVMRDAAGHEPGYCGFLFNYAADVPQPIVYFGYIFAVDEVAKKITAETGKPATWGAILDTFKKREFPDLDAVAEAYRVD